MEREKREELIQEAYVPLLKLLKEVCPMCATEDSLFCEVVDGVSYHTNGECTGSPIRQLMTHMDDIRHQFANKFNEKEAPRFKWGPKRIA